MTLDKINGGVERGTIDIAKELINVGLAYVMSAVDKNGFTFDLLDIDAHRYTDEEIAKKEFDSWTEDMYMNAVIRLVTLELFIRMQQTEDGTLRHIWLTSSNHPLLLNVFNKTEHISFSDELMDAITTAYANLLDLDDMEVASLIQSIITAEDLEGDSEY